MRAAGKLARKTLLTVLGWLLLLELGVLVLQRTDLVGTTAAVFYLVGTVWGHAMCHLVDQADTRRSA